MRNERRLADGRVELVDTRAHRGEPALQPRPRAGADRAAQLDHLQLRRALDLDGALHPDLHAGVGADRPPGMNWWQALVTILLGNTIVLVPILLNSHPGTKYGIPFPVFARAAYGTIGSNLPALMRALVACGWFGIQAWIGGEALHTFFTHRRARLADAARRRLRRATRRPSGSRSCSSGGSTSSSSTAAWTCCARVENWAAPFVLVMTGAAARGGRSGARTASGRCCAQPGKFHDARRVLAGLRPVADRDDRLLGDAVAQHARLHALRPQPARADRSARSSRCRRRCRVFAAMGVLITSATAIIYGEAIWDPVKLVGQLHAAAGRRDLDVHGRRRDARGQHRRQRRVARQRLRQRVSARDQLQDRRPDHRHPRHR